MNRERDLLPWILGGLSTAAVALAITTVSSQRAASPASQAIATAAAVASTASAQPAPALAPAPAPAPVATATAPAVADSAAPVADSAAAAVLPAEVPGETQSEARAAQIWTCTTKGVKTFSNNPCGENSSLLEVGTINTMNPTTPVHYARAYPAQPQYIPPYTEPAAQSYAEEDSAQEGYENGANSYTIVQGVALLPRRRPEHHHPHRPPYHHSPSPAPRKF